MDKKEIYTKKTGEFVLENYQEILRDIRGILEKFLLAPFSYP